LTTKSGTASAFSCWRFTANPDWHGTCRTRVSPTEANYATGWVNAISDGGCDSTGLVF
jgi:hypothetical protein